MHWHLTAHRCRRALILRGYKRGGGFARQAPYAALLVALVDGRGRATINGHLSTRKLARADYAAIKRLCAGAGYGAAQTMRRGARVEFNALRA